MTMPEHQVTWTNWRKSSYSGAGDHEDTHCVEVALGSGAVAVRDSKNTAGPVLTFSSPSFAAFLRGIHSTGR